MFPKPILTVGSFSLSMYEILFLVGILSALFSFDWLCKMKKVSREANRFYYTLGIVAILVGVFSSMAFQALYDYIDWVAGGRVGVFEPAGMTFMGGLIGGVITFLVGYMIFAKGNIRRAFWQVAEIAPASVLIAHFFGRLGCFCAGCCYGKPTTSFLGVHFPGIPGLVYPTQLFEAACLLALFIAVVYLNKKDIRYSLVLYCMGYAVCRFLLEFLRGDERGELTTILSPSQTWSIVLFLCGVGFLALRLIKLYKPEWLEGRLKVFDGYLDPDFDYDPAPHAVAVGSTGTVVEKENTVSDDQIDNENEIQSDKHEGNGSVVAKENTVSDDQIDNEKK